MISRETLLLLQELLDLQQVSVGHPDFAVKAPILVRAKEELADELARTAEYAEP